MARARSRQLNPPSCCASRSAPLPAGSDSGAAGSRRRTAPSAHSAARASSRQRRGLGASIGAPGPRDFAVHDRPLVRAETFAHAQPATSTAFPIPRNWTIRKRPSAGQEQRQNMLICRILQDECFGGCRPTCPFLYRLSDDAMQGAMSGFARCESGRARMSSHGLPRFVGSLPSLGRFDDTGDQAGQSSTSNPGTRSNSRRFNVTSAASRRRACAAIR